MATNITWHEGNVSKAERESLLGQKVHTHTHTHRAKICEH